MTNDIVISKVICYTFVSRSIRGDYFLNKSERKSNLPMKQIFALLLLLSLLGYAKAQQCATIFYSYNDAGHRIQRSYVACDTTARMRNDNSKNDTHTTSVPKTYPNPVEEKLNIDLSKMGYATDDLIPTLISLYDQNGKNLYSESTTSDKPQINMSGFSSGAYLLKIVHGNHHSELTILKK
jgi:hypothetical protein